MDTRRKDNLLTSPRRGLPRLLAACGVLALLTFSAFNTVLENGFIDYDDPGYVTENPRVRQGLTPENVRWAFTTFDMSNWHPLTWLSHMADVELYGLSPAGHHLTSLLIHLPAVLLLYLWLFRTTGAFWLSLLAATLFAIHPLRVESVAWVSERKDVLSACFGIAALWAYWFYVQRPSLGRYGWVVLALLLGLLAKPMLVTWPFVLILVDFWPLRRIGEAGDAGEPAVPTVSFRRSVVEKIPLFLLVAASSAVTYFAQQSGEAVMELERLGLADRLQNAVTGYFLYLGKTFYPVDLALLYPLRGGFNPLRVVLGGGVLAAVSLTAVFSYRRRGWFLTGWFWFLGTLVPVIGLVQVGVQSMADRYSYLPSIGLILVVVWASGELAGRRRFLKYLVVGTWVLIIPALLSLTWLQTYRWKNSLTIFYHAVQVTDDNPVMELNYAASLADAGRVEEAVQVTQAVLRRRPELPKPALQLASLYLRQGEPESAAALLERALEMPRAGKADVYGTLAVAYARQERYALAERCFEKALEAAPQDGEILSDLGLLYKEQGQLQKAVARWREALDYDPYCLPALRHLAWTQAVSAEDSLRDPSQALEHARRLCLAGGCQSPRDLDILAAALAANQQFDRAAEAAGEALARARQQGNLKPAEAIAERLELYRQGRPFRE